MDDPFADLISDLGADKEKEEQSADSENRASELLSDLGGEKLFTKSMESKPSEPIAEVGSENKLMQSTRRGSFNSKRKP